MSWYDDLKPTPSERPDASQWDDDLNFSTPLDLQFSQRERYVKRHGKEWPTPNPRSLAKIEEMSVSAKNERYRQYAKELLEVVKRYEASKARQDTPALSHYRDIIDRYEGDLLLEPRMRVFATPESVARDEIQRGLGEDARYLERKERRRGCNIRVLEVDQFTSSAENIGWYSLQQFDPDELFGGGADVARKAFEGHYELKWVRSDEEPQLGMVWLRDGPNGKLKVWKANYDSSD